MGNEATVRITGKNGPDRYVDTHPWQINTEVRYTLDKDKADGKVSPFEAQRLLQSAYAKIKELLPPDVLKSVRLDHIMFRTSFEIPATEGGGRISGSTLESLADEYKVRLCLITVALHVLLTN